MGAVTALPEGYREIFAVDLQKNKKIALLVNGISLLIGAVLLFAGHMLVPFWTLFDMSQGLGVYSMRFGTLLAGLVLYMVAHELVHGITMKHFGTKKVKYGFTGLYAFAGSEDYYPKKPYITIALAPIVVWGIVLAVVNMLVPLQWFWVVYFIQVSNISGAAGDLYVTCKFAKMPADILVRDSGVGMTVYSREG